MPPKKDNADGGTTKMLVGFEDKDTKLLAAAFVSSIGPDKYDYDLMAVLSGYTSGSLKKMWPPVKKKAIDAHASFATFLGNTGANITAASGGAKSALKATGGRKRKAADADVEGEADTDSKNVEPKSAGAKSDSAGHKSDSKTEIKTQKKAPAAKPKGRATKKIKKEDIKSEEDSADGGDGMDTGKEIEEEI